VKVKIERAYLPQGTFSDLSIDGEYFCHTVEPPWKNNKSMISCISEGIYSLSPHISPKYGACFIVHNENLGVTKYKNTIMRWGILLHPANWPYQLNGCIAPVKQLLVIGGNYGGNNSRATTKDLFDKLGFEKHQLEIVTKTIDNE